MENPPNPRNPGPYIPPAQAPLTSDPELLDKARVALSVIANSHASAVANATNSNLVAKSKIRGSAANMKAVPRIQVKLSKATNRNARASEKNSGLLPRLMDFYETTPFSDVVAGIVASIDLHYVQTYGVRITPSDVTFQYSQSSSILDPTHTSGTLGNLFQKSTGVRISAKDRKNTLLDIQALVNYPPKAESEETSYDSELTYVTGTKRKASSMATNVAKRLALSPAGADFYASSIQRTEDRFLVSRIDCSLDNDGAAVWTENSTTIEVSVRQDSSASGRTKRMHILTLDGHQYAAKSFHDTGRNRAPTLEENIAHLKDELRCQKQVAWGLARFQQQAKTNRVSIADLRVAESFILHVISGPRKHHAWLVDPLLSTTQTTNNADLFGATCDALAQFSLADSAESLVFVDIQGIFEPRSVHGVRGADELVLFDIMQHTRRGGSNIGDKGPEGLEEFKGQHKCNNICRKIPLHPIISGSTPDLPNPESPYESILAQSVNMRLGSGVLKPDSDSATDGTSRGYVRYTGAGFNHTLAVDMEEEPEIMGPFNIRTAKLCRSRSRKGAQEVLLLEFTNKTRGDATDYATQELARFAHAGALIEEYEALLDEKDLSGGDATADPSTYPVLKFQEYKILQGDAKSHRATWLYSENTLPSNSDLYNTKDVAADMINNRKLSSHLDTFSHFVYEKSQRTYVYYHFDHSWLDLEDDPTPTAFIVYFKSSSNTGGTCFGDGGRLGITDFEIEHECGELCTKLGLPPIS
ncbi:hypothetical protein B0H12DRAFT_1231816 [Mycena haematopus]|nr:hypothetical protein B0H12DRAFT_1231816 [Mycena haematopus]